MYQHNLVDSQAQRDLAQIPGSADEYGHPTPPTTWNSSALPHNQ
jgi:hypothetical protein